MQIPMVQAVVALGVGGDVGEPPRRLQGLHAAAEGADARQHHARGVGDEAVVGGQHSASAPTRWAPSGPSAGCRCRSRGTATRSTTVSLLQRPLGGRDPAPSIRTASRRQRATPLNVASTTWWVLRPAFLVTWSVMPAESRRLLEVLGHLGVERRVAGAPRRRARHATNGRPDRSSATSMSASSSGTAAGEAAHAGLVAERLGEGLAEQDADVLDRVVRVDVQVTVGLQGEVEPAVASDLVEHVVEERRPGAGRDRAGGPSGRAGRRCSSPWSCAPWRRLAPSDDLLEGLQEGVVLGGCRR